RQRGERGAERHPPDDGERLGPLTARVLRGIAAGSQASEGTPGPLWGHASEDSTGQLTAGTRRHVALWGLRWLEIPCQANRDPEAGARPPGERKTPHAPHEVSAPPRAICLASCAGALAVTGATLARCTGCFLGGIVTEAPKDL